MTKTIAIRLAVGGLLLVGAAACDGDGEKEGAVASSSPPAAAAPSTGAPEPTPSAAEPTTSAPAPRATPSDPKVTNSKQIVMIDPEGKRYTFTTMAQMAAGMRVTMGKNAPSGFCEKSYQQGVEGGGSFPAGRDAFLAACREGWRKSERWMRQQ